jgi:hypothetical protein
MGLAQRFKGRVAFDAPFVGRTQTGLTAHAGGGQANALQLQYDGASVGTVASANDSVKLPSAVPGSEYNLVNDAATNSMQVYGAGTDTINKVATATGVAQAAGVAAYYFCVTKGNWSRVQSS